MLVTRFILSFLGFYLCYSISREYNECEYQVNISINEFWTLGLWDCCWPDNAFTGGCGDACTISAAIFSKLVKSGNVSLLPGTNVATLATNFPAINGSIPEIWLEFQISRKLEKYVCVVKSVKDHDPNEGSPEAFYGGQVIDTDGESRCRAGLDVTSTLYCPTTTTQVTPSVTMTNTTQTNTRNPGTPTGTTTNKIQTNTGNPGTPTGTTTNTIRTNTGNTTSTKEDAKKITMSTKCIILYTMMVVSYIVAIITITVEIVMCCKMYERSNKFPWCKVYVKEKVVPDEVKAQDASTKEESVTMSLEQVSNPSYSDSSVTCGSEDQDQKVG